MKNFPPYSLLGNEPRVANRLAWKPLLFGLIVGFFLSNIAFFESETVAESLIYEGIGRRHGYAESRTNVTIRCLILIQSATPHSDKFISSIRDTYAKRCDETLYFTSNKDLEKQFASEINIYHVERNLDPRKYSLVHDILKFLLSDRKPSNNTWTILMNEQNYLVVENMRDFLSQLPSNEPIIAGKIVDVRSATDFIFPSQTEMFQLDAGVAISPIAARIIVDDIQNCSPDNWSTPAYTGRALLKCARKTDLRIWDPLDEENKRLFLNKSPRNLFAQSNYVTKGKSFEESRQSSDCCSDKAVIFGLVNYRDQRVLEYALESARVFGV
ncbi:hypothetical protein FO519_001274 [Halicephalobus sp. NKZ332]|nr:hypothetical protein FO519_001274 [Halicephalobus sp. NKZ332]